MVQLQQERRCPFMTGTVRSLGALTLKQERFIDAFFLHDHIAHAAREVGVSERQARRWLHLPCVQAAIEQRRQDERGVLRKRLDGCLEMAVQVVEDVLLDAVNPDEAKRDGRYISIKRVDAYVALLLRYAQDRREIEALRERLALLESAEPVVDATVTRLPIRKV
jgi:hypothetical protein